MVRRPIRALLECANVGRILVLSQSPERIAAAMPEDSRIEFRQSKGTIAQSILSLLEDSSVEWPLLVTTADHALLDSATADEFCARALGADIAIGVVERRAMLKRLPDVRRTWLKFRGGAYTGANLFALRSQRRSGDRALELGRARPEKGVADPFDTRPGGTTRRRFATGQP